MKKRPGDQLSYAANPSKVWGPPLRPLCFYCLKKLAAGERHDHWAEYHDRLTKEWAELDGEASEIG